MNDISDVPILSTKVLWIDQARSVISEVASDTGIDEQLILGETRHAPVAMARREVYYRLWKQGASLPRIGRLLQRHHTTVLYGVRMAERSRLRAA